MDAKKGDVMPESDNARLQPGVIEEQRSAHTSDSASFTPDWEASSADEAKHARDLQDKRIATAMARAALAGCALHIKDAAGSCEFLISRWGLTRSLSDIAAVEEFLDRADGKHA